MAEMVVLPSGGIAFKRTDEEIKISKLKKDLEKDSKELKELKAEYKRELEEIRKHNEAKRSDSDG